jgi:hypothetical protein
MKTYLTPVQKKWCYRGFYFGIFVGFAIGISVIAIVMSI